MPALGYDGAPGVEDHGVTVACPFAVVLTGLRSCDHVTLVLNSAGLKKYQCFGSGSGWIRIIWPDPDPSENRDKLT